MRRFQGVAAIIFASAVGCGKSQTFVDAGGTDSKTSDAATTVDATPMGDVTVTTYSRCCTEPNHTLEPNISVLSVQPDGSAGPSGVTGVDGKVTLSGVLQGASIFAKYPTADGFQLVTMLGVKPGDNLVFGDHYASPVGTATGTPAMTVTFPAYANSTSIIVYHQCGSVGLSGSGLTEISVPITCALTTTNMLVVAQDDSGAIATGVIHAAPFTDAATAPLVTWVPVTAGNFSESITGLDPMVYQVNFHGGMVVDGAYDYQQNLYQAPLSGSATAALMVPTGGDRTFAYVEMQHNGAVGRQETYHREAGSATSSTFTAPALPFLTPPAISGPAQAATWLEIGKGPYDGAVATLQWNRYDAGTQVTTYYRWNIVIPPGVTTLQWATPPTAFADSLPNDSDAVSGHVQLVDLSSATSYDELRKAPEWQLVCPGCATEDGELPTGSSVAFDGGEAFTGLRARAPRAHPAK